jgi:hypothetical protein
MKNFVEGVVKVAVVGTIGAVVGAVIHGIGWVSGFGTGALMGINRKDEVEEKVDKAMEAAEEIAVTASDLDEMLS